MIIIIVKLIIKKLTDNKRRIYKRFRKMVHSVHYYDSIIVLELCKDIEEPMTSFR